MMINSITYLFSLSIPYHLLQENRRQFPVVQLSIRFLVFLYRQTFTEETRGRFETKKNFPVTVGVVKRKQNDALIITKCKITENTFLDYKFRLIDAWDYKNLHFATIHGANDRLERRRVNNFQVAESVNMSPGQKITEDKLANYSWPKSFAKAFSDATYNHGSGDQNQCAVNQFICQYMG